MSTQTPKATRKGPVAPDNRREPAPASSDSQTNSVPPVTTSHRRLEKISRSEPLTSTREVHRSPVTQRHTFGIEEACPATDASGPHSQPATIRLAAHLRPSSARRNLGHLAENHESLVGHGEPISVHALRTISGGCAEHRRGRPAEDQPLTHRRYAAGAKKSGAGRRIPSGTITGRLGTTYAGHAWRKTSHRPGERRSPPRHLRVDHELDEVSAGFHQQTSYHPHSEPETVDSPTRPDQHFCGTPLFISVTCTRSVRPRTRSSRTRISDP